MALTCENDKYMLRIVTKARCSLKCARSGPAKISSTAASPSRSEWSTMSKLCDAVQVIQRTRITGTPRFWPRTLKGEHMRRGRSALDCALKMGDDPIGFGSPSVVDDLEVVRFWPRLS